MFAFAASVYGTLGTDHLVEFDQSTTGDYATAGISGHGVVNISSAYVSGVVELDTGATTVSTDAAGVVSKGGGSSLVLVPNNKTYAPWFAATRALTGTGVDATGQINIVQLTSANPFTASNPYVGMLGSTSTTNYVFHVSASTIIPLGAIDTSNFHDFGMGWDGTTLTAYYGDVLKGTFAAVGTSTDNTGIQSASGQIGALVTAGSAARITLDIDKLYLATAVP